MTAMRKGADALRNIHGSLNIDKVDSTMDSIREQMDLTNEISDAISNPVGMGHDIDEVSFSNYPYLRTVCCVTIRAHTHFTMPRMTLRTSSKSWSRKSSMSASLVPITSPSTHHPWQTQQVRVASMARPADGSRFRKTTTMQSSRHCKLNWPCRLGIGPFTFPYPFPCLLLARLASSSCTHIPTLAPLDHTHQLAPPFPFFRSTFFSFSLIFFFLLFFPVAQ